MCLQLHENIDSVAVRNHHLLLLQIHGYVSAQLYDSFTLERAQYARIHTQREARYVSSV